jgi:hypothetical protein
LLLDPRAVVVTTALTREQAKATFNAVKREAKRLEERRHQ